MDFFFIKSRKWLQPITQAKIIGVNEGLLRVGDSETQSALLGYLVTSESGFFDFECRSKETIRAFKERLFMVMNRVILMNGALLVIWNFNSQANKIKFFKARDEDLGYSAAVFKIVNLAIKRIKFIFFR